MIVRNYPSQELSDIIIKWKMKFSEQSQNELETIFIYRRNDIKNLLKEIQAYRNSMVARNYPSQELSDIITKWEMKLSEQSQDELEPIEDGIPYPILEDENK